MKVTLLATGKTADFDASYGMRLIEQGRAVIAPEKAKTLPASKPEPAEKTAENKPKSKKKQEG